MSDHDKFCLCAAHKHPFVDDCGMCRCWLIAEVRADERDKAATDAIVRAFTVMRAHEFLVRRILTEMEGTDYDAISNRVIEYLIHAIDMDAENAAAARVDGEQA